MKNFLYIISSLGIVLSANATVISGDYEVDPLGETFNDAIVFTTDNLKTYEMSGGYVDLMNVKTTANATVNVITANSDYTVNTKTIVNADAASVGQVWTSFVVAAGKTLTLSDLDTSAMNMTIRGGLKFVGLKTSVQSQYGNLNVSTTDNTTFLKKSTQTSSSNFEVWLNYINYYHNTAEAVYNYVHFQYGCNFICNADASFNNIAQREPYKFVSTRAEADLNPENSFSGCIKMNGYNVTTGGFAINPTKNVCSDFYIDFGSNDIAQNFVISNQITTTVSSGFCTLELCRIFVDNFSSEDALLIKTKLTDDLFAILSINGYMGDDITVTQISEGKYNGYWSYSAAAIPEPATCAVLLGVLAIGFVAYRKRK